MKSFGAKDVAGFDNSYYIQLALDSGYDLDGENLEYEVGGELRMSNTSELSNVTFIDNGKNEIPFSFKIYDRKHLKLKSIKIDRGNNPTVGSVSSSRTLSVINGDDIQMDDIFITGHGIGTAISFIDVQNATLTNANIQDMGWTNQNHNKEQLFGIWFQRVKNVQITNTTIKDLYEIQTDGNKRFVETDGITFSHSSSFKIKDSYIENVSEGIDLTGSDGNTGFELTNVQVRNANAFGIKMANSAYNGNIYNCNVYDAGYAGFVFSGPSEPNLPYKIRDIGVYNCNAYNSGSNKNWENYSVSGFLILEGAYDKNQYPMDIRFYNCTSTDNQNTATTKFGFFNQVQNTGNRVSNVDSFGHTIEGARGF
ncbi:MAG: right-handed parallel beta-helix repeat-containing protein [Bacteroidota bacterium]